MDTVDETRPVAGISGEYGVSKVFTYVSLLAKLASKLAILASKLMLSLALRFEWG